MGGDKVRHNLYTLKKGKVKRKTMSKVDRHVHYIIIYQIVTKGGITALAFLTPDE